MSWREYLPPWNPVLKLLSGASIRSVPAMPICQDTAWLPFCHQRILEKWSEALDAAGAESMALDFAEYVRIRAEVYDDVFRLYTPAPSWVALPVQASRPGLAGSRIERQGRELFHLTRKGRRIRMGEVGAPTSQAVADGTAGLAPTWDSSIGFASFKDHGGWHPPANRVEEFKRGVPVHVESAYDPDALGEGDVIDVEDWIPRYAFRETVSEGHSRADDLIESGLYAVAEAVRRRTHDAHAIYCGGTSPFQNTCYELGFEGLMESMLVEPELVHRAAEKYFLKDHPGREALKRSGVGIVYLFQMFGGGDLFGPRQFEEFVAPAVKQALDFLHERGFYVVYYPMGNATPHLAPMRDLDWDALSLEESRRDYVIDIAEVRRVMGPDRLLFGNVAASLIETGTRAQLIAEARRQIRGAGEHGHFILSCGTPIMPGTAAERVRLFCQLPELI